MDRGLGRDAGFTLIELMIAVTVLALLTTTLTLSASRPRGQAASDAARFEAVYRRLRAEAVLSRQVLALAVDAGGYRRLEWRAGWHERGDAVHWQGEVAVLDPADFRAPLQVLPSGEATPFRLRFSQGGVVRICASDGWAPVTCAPG